MTSAIHLTARMLVDMTPVYTDFDLTDTAEYLVSESEYGVVESVEPAEAHDGIVAVLVHFENFPSWKLAANYEFTTIPQPCMPH